MSYEKTYEVTVRGTAPLLHNRFEGKGTGKSEVTKSSQQYDPDEMAKKALYTDSKGNPAQPSIHFEESMTKAAVLFKIPGSGKKTFKDAYKGGVIVEPLMIPHKKPDWVKDIRPVVVGRARIERVRPRFDEWELTFRVKVIDSRIPGQVIKDTLEESGAHIGVGDYRPKFGRYEVVHFKEVSN